LKNSSPLGADVFVKTLEDLGVEVIIGIPGSHDARLYNALRKSAIRTVLATNELHAAFMANGYYRSSGKTGAMMAIAGPGFTNSITGLTEAFFDSAGMVCVICTPSNLPGKAFQLQKIDEKELVRTVTKGSFFANQASDIEETLRECFNLVSSGEPGPALLEISSGALSNKSGFAGSKEAHPGWQKPSVDDKTTDKIINLLSSSRRALLYLGQGAAGAAKQVSEIVDILKTPVLTTTSGRGVLPENHAMSLPSDLVDNVDIVNAILDSCDLILALGCKFTHNGTKGFRLKFPEDKLIHVDASSDVLGANYPARIALSADAAQFLDALLENRERFEPRETGWESGKIAHWRQSLIKSMHKRTFPEPHFEGMDPATAKAFFSSLQEVLPENACVITDSGLHQMLARKYFKVTAPRGFLVPSDFQSMGFGIPAGIGAKLADPDRHVVVITGDGGFALSGMELFTAVRERINITVFLMNDRHLGLIRLQQLNKLGHSHAVRTSEINYSKFCESCGIQYFQLNDNLHQVVNKSLNNDGVSLIEVILRDSIDLKKSTAKGLLKNILKI